MDGMGGRRVSNVRDTVGVSALALDVVHGRRAEDGWDAIRVAFAIDEVRVEHHRGPCAFSIHDEASSSRTGRFFVDPAHHQPSRQTSRLPSNAPADDQPLSSISLAFDASDPPPFASSSPAPMAPSTAGMFADEQLPPAPMSSIPNTDTEKHCQYCHPDSRRGRTVSTFFQAVYKEFHPPDAAERTVPMAKKARSVWKTDFSLISFSPSARLLRS